MTDFYVTWVYNLLLITEVPVEVPVNKSTNVLPLYYGILLVKLGHERQQSFTVSITGLGELWLIDEPSFIRTHYSVR